MHEMPRENAPQPEPTEGVHSSGMGKTTDALAAVEQAIADATAGKEAGYDGVTPIIIDASHKRDRLDSDLEVNVYEFNTLPDTDIRNLFAEQGGVDLPDIFEATASDSLIKMQDAIDKVKAELDRFETLDASEK